MKEHLQAAHTVCTPQSTKKTIGVDLGDRRSRYCVVELGGTIFEKDRVRTTVEGLERRFGKVPAARIIIESTWNGKGHRRTPA